LHDGEVKSDLLPIVANQASQPIPDRLNAIRNAIEDNGYLGQVLDSLKSLFNTPV
jgi:hypothetical protein